MTDTCVYPGCKNTPRTRGLCHNHYQTARSYIRDGKTTEAFLELRGLLLPKGTPGGSIDNSRYFLPDSEWPPERLHTKPSEDTLVREVASPGSQDGKRQALLHLFQVFPDCQMALDNDDQIILYTGAKHRSATP